MTSKASLIVAIVAGICLPLMVSSLSFSSNFGSVQEMAKTSAAQSELILERQTAILDKLTQQKVENAKLQQTVEHVIERQNDIMSTQSDHLDRLFEVESDIRSISDNHDLLLEGEAQILQEIADVKSNDALISHKLRCITSIPPSEPRVKELRGACIDSFVQ